MRDLHNNKGVISQLLVRFAQHVGLVLLAEKFLERRHGEVPQWLHGIEDGTSGRWKWVRCDERPALDMVKQGTVCGRTVPGRGDEDLIMINGYEHTIENVSQSGNARGGVFTNHIASLDSSKNQRPIARVVRADICQNIPVWAMWAGAKLLHEPPGQAVDDVGQLSIGDGHHARSRHPLGVLSIWPVASQSVDNVWQQFVPPPRGLLVLVRHFDIESVIAYKGGTRVARLDPEANPLSNPCSSSLGTQETDQRGNSFVENDILMQC